MDLNKKKINNREGKGKSSNTWKLNNTLPNNPKVRKKALREFFQCIKNQKKNTKKYV